MPFQVAPGINVKEIDLTTTVPAVATTTGGIAGHFKWGPVDQRVLVDSEDKLVAVYGKPVANTADDFFTAANFLAYSNSLQVVRVVSSANNATTGSVGAFIKNPTHYEEVYSNIGTHGDWIAKYPGDIGNSLKISVCQNANAWQSTISTSYYATRNSKTLTLAGDGQGSSNAAAQFVVGDYVLVGPDRQALKVGALLGNTVTFMSNYTGNTVSNYSTDLIRRWEFFSNFGAAPRTTAYANTNNSQGDAIHIAVVDADGIITGSSGSVLEVYDNVSQAPDAKTEDGAVNYYKDVVNQNSSYVWFGAHNSSLTRAGVKASLGTNYPGANLPKTNNFNYGKDGATPSAAQKIAGFDLFRESDEVDVSFLLGSSADTTLATHIINLAETRKDCLAVVSPERADVVNNNAYLGKEKDDIISFRNTLPASSYGVMDSGWKYQYDKYNDVYRYVPLNGDTAGIMVQTDLTADPWFSPAGFNRGAVKNVVRLAYSPSKADRVELHQAGVNAVVSFKGQGTVLFDDKTMLKSTSAFSHINVRRLFIVLEKAIATAANFTLFEFNDEFTRSQFKNMVEPFLRDVKGRRGITGFQVVCDSSNNTAGVVSRNEFVGDIYVRPNYSINYIQLNFVAVRGGVEFSEIVG